MLQAHLARDVLKCSATEILIENALLAARRELPALEGIRTPEVKAAATFLVPRVDANIRHEQIQQAVLVKVEEDRARGMGSALHCDSRFRSDVLELSAAKILEQDIAHPHRRDEEVRQTVIVDVRKRGGDADLVRQRNARCRSNVFKLPTPQIPPELARSELIDEVKVQPAIAIHVRRRQTVAVVVMNRLVVLGPVIHRAMFKANTALLPAIGEGEIVKGLPRLRRLNLLLLVLLQRPQRALGLPVRIDDLPGRDDVRAEQRPRRMQKHKQRGASARAERNNILHGLGGVGGTGGGKIGPRARRNPTK